MRAVPTRLLDGWGQIAETLTAIARVEISTYQADQYARREVDPLPVKVIGRFFRRARVVAEPDELEAWARREFVIMKRSNVRG